MIAGNSFIALIEVGSRRVDVLVAA